MAIKILHTNDFHGKLTEDSLPQLVALREMCDLYFDCGDSIKSGNLAIPIKSDPVWPLLQKARVTATVPGNRESHILNSVVQTKFSGSTHPILCSNWFRRDGTLFLQNELKLEKNGLKIGIFGVMVPMVTDRMASRHTSQFLWTQPIPAAQSQVQNLRPHVDLLICLSHIGLTQDRRLAEACPEIDLILGGHSHSVLTEPEIIGKTAICQTGSHARFMGNYVWDGSLQSYELIPWRQG
ncbi:hypothetical protein C0431_03480 [bacterium]|nr:hypothetical protein [bacterium]